MALRLQTGLWVLFLIGYTALKYFAGYNAWNTQYAIQVAILVLMTAVAPFYLSKAVSMRAEGAGRWVMTLVLPVLLCAIGYGLFWYFRVKPSFPDVTLLTVLPRSLLPGLSISVLLLIPKFMRG
ncbi:MAG: hypothetical protein EP340_06110 [Alphaproteobacteria bacterium]|nr:MAG: hypothetical protein EP340_06110 [Alphaproteobacteria bacterium]